MIILRWIWLSPSVRYLSIPVRDYQGFSFSYNRLVKAFFLMGSLEHSTLWLSLQIAGGTKKNKKKNSLCVSTPIWKKRDAVRLLKKIPLSTLCIKWLASKMCCAVSYERLCFCLIAAGMKEGGGMCVCLKHPPPRSAKRSHTHTKNALQYSCLNKMNKFDVYKTRARPVGVIFSVVSQRDLPLTTISRRLVLMRLKERLRPLQGV